ncbi:MAG TPA: hypothetical protein VFG48_08015 [Xanthomonadales bacterium]|nr:hypothetical protein [Xanthomonadales bacterium]
MDDITAFSYKGGNGLRPSGNGLRLAVYSFLWFFIASLICGGAWAAGAHRLMAAGDSAFGILPMALGKPAGCHWEDGRVLNDASVADGLGVFGGAVCPTEREPMEYVPYYWHDGGWVQAQQPGELYYDGYIDAVSADPAAPVMVYVMRRSDGDDTTFDGLALVVVEAGQEPVELAPLADMRLVAGRAEISANGNVVVAQSGTGDWEIGYTYRATRWVRMGAGWSAAEDIGEGAAVAASADGQIIVGNGDGETWGATGGKGWVWVGDDKGGGAVTSLGDDARVTDISQSGSVIIGSRPEPCDPDQWCDYYPVPVFWAEEGGEWVVHDLPRVDGAEGYVIAVAEIESQPVILGQWLFFDSFTIRAAVWLQEESGAYGAPLMLETLGANPDSIAYAMDINREGVVLGWSELKPWGDGSSVVWSLKEALPFRINPGIGDAWYNPETDGQGFFINVWEDIQTMFVGWYTYGAGAADGSHYWMTAQGPYSDNVGQLEITLSEGGAFDSPQPAPQRAPDGTMTIEFKSCLEGTVSYDIPSIGRQGAIPIRRLTHDQVFYCESRSVPGGE